MHSSLYYHPMATKENKSLYEAVDVPSVGWRGYRPSKKLDADTLTLGDAWVDGGLFLFAANRPQDPDKLLDYIKEDERNNPQGQDEIQLVWLNNPEGPLTSCPRLKLISVTTGSRRTDNNFFINLGNAFTFNITSQTPFQFVSERERLEFKLMNTDRPNIQFMDDVTKIVDSVVYLPLGGKDGGAFRFTIQAASEKLYDRFDVGLKYFYEDNCKKKEQNYPLFEKEPLQSLNFRVSLDPLDPFNREYGRLPDLGLRSYMAFDPGTKPLPSHFRTSFGRTVQLRPNVHFEEDNSGGEPRPTAGSGLLVFSPRYKGKISTNNSAYTIPQGHFSLSIKDTELSDGQAVRLLCGSTGTETVAFVPHSKDNAPYEGDQLLFVPGKNAFWPSNPVDPGRSERSPLLTDEAYTAWVSVRPNNGRLPESLPIGYSSQPEDEPHYRPSAEGVSSFYEPTLYDWMDDEGLNVPLVPLLGVQREDVAQMEASLALERCAIAPNRKRLMDERSESPPIRGNTLRATEGWSTTPHGLLVQESAGSWSELRLGQNDRNGGEFIPGFTPARDVLRFSGLSTTFRNVLLSNRLFLVISVNQGTLWNQFDDLVTISGWPFRLAVPNSNADNFCNVLIFKYGPGTLAEVIKDPARWTDAELFNDPALGELERLSAWMSNHCRLDVPLEDLPPEFVPFYRMCHNPEWNGVVALNVDIVKEQMPDDLIGLLGGMNSETLRAHHIGLNSTRVEWDDAGGLRMDKPSSLFAYVDYKDTTDPNWKNDSYDFRVTKLEVRFANSKIESFHGKMELLVRKLYGSPISIAGTSDPVLTLTGTIERHEGIPTYVFQTERPVQTKIVDGFVKLRNILLSKISFQTIDASDKNHIQTRFSLWGSKAFTDNLSNQDGVILDLFGYGSEGADLLFGNLGITMKFSLFQSVTNSREFAFDASQVALDPEKSTRRGSSLAAHFPLRLRKLMTTNNLDDWEKEGYRNINLNSVSDPRSRQEPWYGLEFTFNMGDLGKLMPEGGLVGSLIAGWNATGDVYCALKLPALDRERGLLALQEMLDLELPNFELLPSADGTYRMTTHASARLFGKSYPIHLVIFQSLDTQKGQIGWYATTHEESE